jgi:hypothetical protein
VFPSLPPRSFASPLVCSSSRLSPSSSFLRPRLSAPAPTAVFPFWEHLPFFSPRSRQWVPLGLSTSRR